MREHRGVGMCTSMSWVDVCVWKCQARGRAEIIREHRRVGVCSFSTITLF